MVFELGKLIISLYFCNFINVNTQFFALVIRGRKKGLFSVSSTTWKKARRLEIIPRIILIKKGDEEIKNEIHDKFQFSLLQSAFMCRDNYTKIN